MVRNPWLHAAATLLVGLSVPAASHAQMFTAGGGIAPTMAMNQVMQQGVRASVSQTMRRSGGGRASDSARYATAPPRGAAFAAGSGTQASALKASTGYRASPAVTARVKQQYVDFIGKSLGAKAAQDYQGALAKRDFVENWAQLVSSEGLRPGDAADAVAAYWMLNYLIANGLTESSPGSGRNVATQIRGTVMSNPDFARLNEAQRQEMAEVLMLNFLTQQAAYDHAVRTKDDTLKRKLGEAAVTRFRNEMGVDLRQLQLTSSGFVRG